MLPKEQQDFINATLGVTADELAKAISDEQEVKLELPQGRFLTKEQEETLLDNHGKQRYDSGKSKALKEAFDGKSKEDFLSDYKASVLEEAKIEPAKKVEELENSIKTLQQKYNTDISEKDRLLSEKESSLKRIEITSKISNSLPDLVDAITSDVAVIMFNKEHEIKEDGIYRNGQLLKNDLQAPLNLEQAVDSFVTEKNWKKQEHKGHGGKKPSAGGSTPKTYEEFQEYCKSKNMSEGSYEAKQYLKSLREKNPEFQMD